MISLHNLHHIFQVSSFYLCGIFIYFKCISLLCYLLPTGVVTTAADPHRNAQARPMAIQIFQPITMTTTTSDRVGREQDSTGGYTSPSSTPSDSSPDLFGSFSTDSFSTDSFDQSSATEESSDFNSEFPS